MNNEVKINIPEGMEIDKENSTLECIKFKPKWIPKKGDIAVTGDDSFHKQIILIAEYVKPSALLVGFDIEPLALLSSNYLSIYDNSREFKSILWVKQEASASEKEQLIKELDKKGYVYNPNDPRVIYKKEKELPKTWEEFCKYNPIKDGEFFIGDDSEILEAEPGLRGCTLDANALPSKEYAKAMLALCKLIQLRDCYNDGWQADWAEEGVYYCIFYCNGKIKLDTRYSWHCILVFKSSELRDTFYNNFKDLIEQAKLLL